ncbi:MAG: rhodanese-like domain-containing protein, partial [Anaerolineae bacterium]
MATRVVDKVKSGQTPRPRRLPWVVAAMAALLLVAIAAVIWVQPSADRVLTVTAAADAPDPDVPRMEIAQAKRLADSGQALLIDVRGGEYYQQSHIDGAISVPYDQVEQRL